MYITKHGRRQKRLLWLLIVSLYVFGIGLLLNNYILNLRYKYIAVSIGSCKKENVVTSCLIDPGGRLFHLGEGNHIERGCVDIITYRENENAR